ncbi:MAG: phosphopantothenoylcysteine decarboxylase [Candidatus Omnitrophica bacterium]|nr:phosphopantothenoylcysteine decarboxylase [Candidatus Omnitrophota bacterium]
MKQNKRIILGVTGSIAAYKSADITRRLLTEKYCVTVVMTVSSEQFITPLTLAALSRDRVYRGMFDERCHPEFIHHVGLAQDADAVLIAPATANIIGKIAAGLADDLLTCLVMATKAPILIAPAMNTVMYENKIYQNNCKKLHDFGFHFIEPIEGQLACRDEGKGHLAPVSEIVKAVNDLLQEK